MLNVTALVLRSVYPKNRHVFYVALPSMHPSSCFLFSVTIIGFLPRLVLFSLLFFDSRYHSDYFFYLPHLCVYLGETSQDVDEVLCVVSEFSRRYLQDLLPNSPNSLVHLAFVFWVRLRVPYILLDLSPAHLRLGDTSLLLPNVTG